MFLLAMVGNAWGETYTITFKTNTSDGSTEIGTSTKTSTVISSGADYVSGFTFSCSKAYYASKSGVKLGSNGGTGTLEFNIATTYQSNITKITVKSAKYSSDTGTLTLYSGSTSLKTGITPGTDYTHTFGNPTTVSSIKITTSAKRAYVSEIILETGSTELSAPSITTQPTGATYDQGDAATALTVAASGNPTPTYKWYSNTTNSNESGSEISGATSASYTPSTSNTGTTYYYCVATNSKGSATSNAVAVTVNAVTLYTVTFDAGSGSCTTPSATQASKGASVTLPTPTISIEGCKFAGWATTKITEKTETKPTILTGTTYTPTEDVTLYAVYEISEGGNGGYLLSETSSGTTYYMKSDASATTDVSEATEFFWGDGYLYSEKNNVKTYIFHKTSGSTLLEVSSSTPTNLWTITDNETTIKFRSTVQNTRYIGYGSNYFKAYATTHTLTKTQSGTKYYSSVIKTPTSIEFGGSLTKTVYTEEETFDPAGITVLASYEGQAEKEDVTSKATINYSKDPLTVGTTQVQVSASWKGQNCQDNYNITVNAIPTYTITASAATGGIYSVKIGDGEEDIVPDAGTTYQSRAEKVITLTSVASEGYKLHSTPFVVKDADDTEVKVSKSGDNYTFTMPAKAVTITAQFVQQFTIATTTPEDGTITSIKDGDGNDITATSKGSKVWVTVTPDTHYHLKAITVKKADESTVNVTVDPENKNRASFTMPASNVTVSATFMVDTKYDVAFWAQTDQVGSVASYYEGEDIIFPTTNPEDVSGMKFVGWTTTEIDGTTNDEPTLVTSAKMGTESITYYAVYANVEGSAVVDEITADDLNGSYDENNNTTFIYADFSDLSKTSSAVYAGNTGATNDGGIVLRAKNNNSGIVSTTSGGKITKVEISAWNTTGTTTNRQIDVYGSNTAYTAASNLYADATAGTLVGSMNYNTNGEGITTAVVFNDEYDYVGIRSNSGALAFDKLIITYGSTTYSNYCTTVPQRVEATISDKCYDTNKETGVKTYYSTFSTSELVKVPADVTVSEVGLENDKLKVASYQTGDVVAAGRGLLISSATAGTKYFEVVEGDIISGPEATASPLLDGEDDCNLLRPTGAGITAAQMAEADANSLYYRLTMHNGTQIGFWWGAENGAAFDLGANKAYLAVPKAASVKAQSFWFGDNATSISAPAIENNANDAIYNLNGQRVNTITKGMYIKNGKKYFVK